MKKEKFSQEQWDNYPTVVLNEKPHENYEIGVEAEYYQHHFILRGVPFN